MRSRDARSLPQAAQEELRRRAVTLVGAGRTQVAVAALLDVSRQAVGRWLGAHRTGGAEALRARRRGRRRGQQMVLSARQQAQIARTIVDKHPDQLRLPGFLWTRELVAELIERRCGPRLSLKTVGRYLRAWGFSPQKPMRRAFEQQPARVRAWLETEYPAIVARARGEGARILWGDEMGLRSDHSVGRSWSPVGQTPVVKGAGQRFGANVISAVSNKGGLSFMVFTQRFAVPVFLDFLRRLSRHADGRKIHLILDGHPVHRAKKVRAWQAAHAERIELHFLPPYSPELNPTELLNHDVKANAVGRRRPASQSVLIGDARSYLRRRQRQPHIVARYFNEKHVAYAAAQ
ncbi:MAG: IS630 family transposase [Candidatus Limnocylindria bacterium]